MVKRYRNKKSDNLRLWNIYHGMKKRCNNPNCVRYKDYGGRGIVICPEWQDDFDAFADWAKTNGYDDTLTIDRVDVDGNYEPSNCRWITLKEQSRNMRKTVYAEYKGVKKPLIEWCEELGLVYDTVHDRITRRGWSVEKAFETKSQQENSFRQQCIKHNINPGTARDRIEKLGWDMERALNTPSQGRGANGLTYKSQGGLK